MTKEPAPITLYICDNCPSRPAFTDMNGLLQHWQLTHTVPMVQTENDPWGQRPPRTKKLWHTELAA